MLKSLIITSFIITFIIFFGLLFGLNYEEIKNTYISPTYCNTLNTTIAKKYSCTTICDNSCTLSSSDSCMTSKSKYESLIYTNPNEFTNNTYVSQECNNGPKCCGRCCSTCTRVTQSDGHTLISTYSCNCRCCLQIESSKCTTNCVNYFLVTLLLDNNYVYTQSFNNFIESSSFSDTHQVEWRCFLNHDKQEVYLHTQMTDWKVVLLSLSVISVIVSIILLIIDCFYPDLCCDRREDCVCGYP